MLMNQLEFMSMNNPIRRYIQERIEISKLRHFSQLPSDRTVLEIGCGSGYGTKLIKKYFKPKKIYAIDLDKRMIDIAKRDSRDSSIYFVVGDAARLPYEDSSFDAVFDFGIIHHIPNWKDCLDELKRVLKPGGELVLEDLSIETFTIGIGNIYRKVLDHPYKQMFTRAEFLAYLEKIGFKIVKKEINNPLGLMEYFIVIARNNRRPKLV